MSPDRRPLDAAVRDLRADPGRTWGLREAVLAVAAVPASLAAGLLVLILLPGQPGLVGTGVATLVMTVLAVRLARPAAQQSGGVGRALGLGPPLLSDVGRVLGWSVLLLVVQVLTVSLLVGLVPALREASPDNVGFVRGEPWASVLVLAVLAVVVAPFVEELLFRGVVLRGLMLRAGFWPAAATSSALFGVFHAQGSPAEAALLATATGVFGLGLCVLVRRTGRLAPAIGVHAVRNALALSAALLV